MTVSVFRPEKIHLQQAQVADRIHRVLRDERAVLVLLEREQIDQRLVADDHAGRVHGGVARQVFQHERGVDQLAGDFLGVVGGLEFGRLLQRLRQVHLQVGRDHLGEPIALAVAQPHHAAHVAHDRFGAHRAEGDDLRHGIVAVFLADVFDDVGAAVVGEIDVDIRRVDAFGIEESLEEQPVADRIDVRNLQQIGDDGTGGRTARHAGDAVARGRSGRNRRRSGSS